MIKLLQPKFWYKRNLISYLLLPFSIVYLLVITIRRKIYNLLNKNKFSVPVIVVGNITVGGTGKTPLVIYLVDMLKKKGHNPGVVSRGYGRKGCKKGSILVDLNSNALDVGDETLLISRKSGCPVIVDVDRLRGARKLVDIHKCDVVISDDGLQHYRLPRYVEIVVFDSMLGFGNEFCLPAGPLRESMSRLNHVDFVVENFNTDLSSEVLSNKYSMFLKVIAFRNVKNPELTKIADDFKGKAVHAVAGIGSPQKFFNTLREQGLDIIEHSFPDHHNYQLSDFSSGDNIIIMTEKDAVKCGTMAKSNFWYVEVSAELSDNFLDDFLKKINMFSR